MLSFAPWMIIIHAMDTLPRLPDAAHLRSFRAEHGKRAHAGLLLHAGAETQWLAPDVLAVPWWRVL
jgi:hypothetical protein